MSDPPDHEPTRAISTLTKDRILQILVAHGVYIPNANNKTKAQLLDLIKSTPVDCQVALIEAAEAKLVAQQLARTDHQKRKVASEAARRLDKRQKNQHTPDHPAGQRFLVIPAEEVVRRCHKAFLDATSNTALKSEVCICCARRLFASAGRTMALDAVPNSSHLKPSVPHDKHVLTMDMLLETEFIRMVNGKQHGWFCDSCTRALVQNRLPPLALANRMWIGPVPDQLSELTVPERSLISIYHPRCYVYKLHPHNLWTHGGADTHLQTGLAGNVTTYALNLPEVVKMISGKLLPRPLAILSATIVITMIGPGNIPPNWLLGHFKFAVQQFMQLSCVSNALPLVAEVPLDILATMRHDPDLNTAQHEAESYLHNENIQQSAYPNFAGEERGELLAKNSASTNTAPDVIPLQHLAAVDMDLSSIAAEELMQYGLAKIAGQPNAEGGYVVRHGHTPVNEFGHRPTNRSSTNTQALDPVANLSANTFPWLYAYGEGGIEAERPVYVSMAEHVRCNIEEWSGRFCCDPVYVFLFFSILQKRQAMLGTSLTMKRADFDNASALFSTLTLADLSRAAEESAKGQAPSNPTVSLLRCMVHSAGGKVMGSDASRATYRSQIASSSLSLNPPSLWMTINPTDLHDPIVQVFAGEDINMDHFNSALGPDAQRRAETLAGNPYAAAKFFNYLIKTMLL
ncbi:hypothetical protein FS749_002407 [Ceratobasidium sp. UAMH 11750]|nr:hypothetical protein FS749_002407 [Ceratobasidium sp. UAMH 11750]